MNSAELEEWFKANGEMLETAYLQGVQPWEQSGFGLRTPRTYEMWEAQRRPIADCMDADGSFLDIGCANGCLLECVLRWTGERGVTVVPYGLDLSEELCKLARRRLPEFAGHVFAGNAWNWTAPCQFTYVRTELEYVPPHLNAPYVERLLDLFVEPGGKLLVAEYRAGKGDTRPQMEVDSRLMALGFAVADAKVGFRDGVEQTRVAVIPRTA